MDKPKWSAKRINDELQQKVNSIREISDDHASVMVGAVYWHEPDADGCNWNVSTIRNGQVYLAEIMRLIQGLRLQVDLESNSGK